MHSGAISAINNCNGLAWADGSSMQISIELYLCPPKLGRLYNRIDYEYICHL